MSVDPSNRPLKKQLLAKEEVREQDQEEVPQPIKVLELEKGTADQNVVQMRVRLL